MIITGNFNIHYFEKVNNADQLKDMMEAMGLVQFVNFPTHLLGNCLDLVFTEQIGGIKISNIREEDMFLDHKTIIWDILFDKSEMKLETISFRNWKNLYVEHFCNSLKLEELNCDQNIGLHEFLVQYDERLSDQCKIFVPIKITKLLTGKLSHGMMTG